MPLSGRAPWSLIKKQLNFLASNWPTWDHVCPIKFKRTGHHSDVTSPTTAALFVLRSVYFSRVTEHICGADGGPPSGRGRTLFV